MEGIIQGEPIPSDVVKANSEHIITAVKKELDRLAALDKAATPD
mgnify:FL=1